MLVASGAVFIGSHLADALMAGDTEVHVLDDLRTGNLRALRRQKRWFKTKLVAPVSFCSFATALYLHFFTYTTRRIYIWLFRNISKTKYDLLYLKYLFLLRNGEDIMRSEIRELSSIVCKNCQEKSYEHCQKCRIYQLLNKLIN